jgi:hypothetical protein
MDKNTIREVRDLWVSPLLNIYLKREHNNENYDFSAFERMRTSVSTSKK